VTFLDPSINLWDLHFPELPLDPNPLIRIVLICKACKQGEVVYPDEAEVLVVETAGTLHRHCNRCHVATTWSHASPADAESILLRAEEIPAKPEVIATAVNKRKSKRLPSKFSACVRLVGSRGELVACEDISRGGLSFRSLTLYPRGTEIEVAVPYTKGAGNIFVRARIVNVKPVGKLFRHGAAYLRSETLE
jgi:PilZ domain